MMKQAFKELMWCCVCGVVFFGCVWLSEYSKTWLAIALSAPVIGVCLGFIHDVSTRLRPPTVNVKIGDGFANRLDTIEKRLELLEHPTSKKRSSMWPDHLIDE